MVDKDKKTPHQEFIEKLYKQANPDNTGVACDDDEDDEDDIRKAIEDKFDELFGDAEDD